jgi:hypothetical protein
VIPALTKTEKTKLAGIILGEISPSALLFIILSRPQNTKELVALLGPFIPGDTLREKVSYALSVTRTAFDSDARFREVAEGVLDKLRGVTDDEGEPVSPSDRLRCAFVTPMLAYSDTGLVRRQADALRSAGYNAVCSLIDLQTADGKRDYVTAGRMATKLTPKGEANLEALLSSGLVPVVIIRNDWAVRTKSGSVPSIGGQPTSQADFYSAARLRYEKQFLDSLQGYYKHIHIQLSIEPEHPASADFALQLARHLRAAGFRNRLFVNPYSAAVAAHEAIRGELAAVGVEWARSHHGDSVPPDPVWNTDGDTALNGSNIRARVAKMQASGKDWILWTQSLANSHGDFPAECMDVGLSEQTLPAMITGHEKGFLWKPVGENSGKLRVLLPEVWTGKVDRGSVQLWRGGERIETLASTGVANGNREHFQAKKPGGAYNAGVEVRATEGGRTWAWAIPNPAGRNENLKAERVAR